MVKQKTILIGLFGGSFDPPHIGHLKISLAGIKKIKLDQLYWIVTNQNPFKKKTFYSINERLKKCKDLTKKNNKIKVKFLDKVVKSVRTVDVLKYLIKKNKNSKFFLFIGSDNLINLHKWKNSNQILKLSKLVVFSRKGFDRKAKTSQIVKKTGRKEIIYIKNSRIDISSSQLRKFYLQ